MNITCIIIHTWAYTKSHERNNFVSQWPSCMLLKLNYKCQIRHYLGKLNPMTINTIYFFIKFLKTLTAHKSQICRIMAYKWVIRLSPSTVSQKTNSNGYKYPITLKKLQTWLQKENEQIFSTWECCVQKHKNVV